MPAGKLTLGRKLSDFLAEMAPPDRPVFLLHLEREAKAEADLQTLRAIKEYRELAASPPTSTKPPETD